MAFPWDRGREQCSQSQESSLAKNQWPAALCPSRPGWEMPGWKELELLWMAGFPSTLLTGSQSRPRCGPGLGVLSIKCSSYLAYIINKHQWLVLQKKYIFIIKIIYVACFLVKHIKSFGYTSLHFYVCICFFSTTLITKLLLWTCVVNSWLATKLFWKRRQTTTRNPLIYTANDIP